MSIKLFPGNPYPLGARVNEDNSVNIAFVSSKDSTGIGIYNKSSDVPEKYMLSAENKIGSIYCVRIEGIDLENAKYTLIAGDEEYPDPYGKLICGNESYGVSPKFLKASFVRGEIATDYSINRPVLHDYSDTIMYLLHVRGFTKHKSSGVKNPGTFEGIVEKIPYLKELGVNSIELMPAYEFVELEAIDRPASDLEPYENVAPKLNYWGYKEGYYFAPKASYAAKGVKPTDSFRNMVTRLHEENIEVIMQFYFPDSVKRSYVLDVLKFWVAQYHIDGFHLMGSNIPTVLVATEPLLSNTKLMYYDFPVWDIYGNDKPEIKNLAVYNDDYMYSIRRFLKSDEGQLKGVMSNMRDISDTTGRIHYLTNSNGFTLMDLVSYDRKHNADNGENDRDGNPYNASWNCGIEGSTTRKSVLKLRRKQIYNAIAFNMLTQSTPLILAGDEFGNTQKGNNNPYCIDGPLTWLNWKDLDKNKDIYQFYKQCIEFRMSNPILHMKRPFRMSDYMSSGCPDMSFHGEEAWKVEMDDLTRHYAMLLATDYGYADANGKAGKDKLTGDYIYIAINMHWVEHDFAIPKIDSKKEWEVVFDTSMVNSDKNRTITDSKKITIKDRSIVVLKTK